MTVSHSLDGGQLVKTSMVANLPKPAPTFAPWDSPPAKETAVEIRVQGTVQGVGFRPMVYQLAHVYQLRGEVFNDAAGVVIRVAGSSERVTRFVAQLRPSAPPLAHIETSNASPSFFRMSPSRPS
jgi:hydrogenase maturation protein HypF